MTINPILMKVIWSTAPDNVNGLLIGWTLGFYIALGVRHFQ